MQNDDNTPLCTKRAARRVGLTPRTMEQWRFLGKGPPFLKIGRSIRYLPDELEAWITSKRCDPELATNAI